MSRGGLKFERCARSCQSNKYLKVRNIVSVMVFVRPCTRTRTILLSIPFLFVLIVKCGTILAFQSGTLKTQIGRA